MNPYNGRRQFGCKNSNRGNFLDRKGAIPQLRWLAYSLLLLINPLENQNTDEAADGIAKHIDNVTLPTWDEEVLH
jgi:hypothetical protein